MKLIRPDKTATEKWESKTTKDGKGKPFVVQIKTNVGIRELNAVMSMASEESNFNANHYIISSQIMKIITPIEDENGDQIKEIPRDEFATDGVNLIEYDFLDSLPPKLFLELSDYCTNLALTKLTIEQVKN
tara:strand:- start:834 stop:1226 length:393 start_codon:yes stop_codon:yes gene_type:complete